MAIAHQQRKAMAPLSTESLVGPVIDASLDAVVIADLDGHILRVNPAAELIFGYEPGSMIGLSISEAIVPAGLRVAHDRGLAHHAATGERKVIGQRLELEAQHTAGHLIPVELQIEEIEQGDQRVYAAFIRDLSEHRAMEAEVARQREEIHQHEKLKALGNLLGGVAHELNNPLAVVIGRAAILEDVLAGTSEEKTVVKLREAAERCSRIVRTFLAVSRNAVPRPGEVDLNQMLAGALEFTGYEMRKAGVAVSTSFDPAVGRINGDYDQLAQALIALIMNAQQALAGRPGPRTLRVETSRQDHSVTISVIDNGPGIARAIRARVFEPFFTTRAFGEGGGSGLAIARGIFESHDGTIAIGDTVTDGTVGGCTLTITLPAGGKA